MEKNKLKEDLMIPKDQQNEPIDKIPRNIPIFNLISGIIIITFLVMFFYFFNPPLF